VEEFVDLAHWTGSQWQAGSGLPDAKIGWVLVNAQGGHPGAQYAAIRRWTCPQDGHWAVAGSLQHGSGSGDGVHGRLVSNRQGLLGQWEVHNNSTSTELKSLQVVAGETIDFLVDCRSNENADSFSWTAKLTNANSSDGQVRDTVADFHGPVPADDHLTLPSQLHYAWQLILSRAPSQQEMLLAMDFAAKQLAELQLDEKRITPGSSAIQQVLANFCHTLLNTSEFVYVD
jgi:hypothetical protein